MSQIPDTTELEQEIAALIRLAGRSLREHDAATRDDGAPIPQPATAVTTTEAAP